MVVLSDLIVLNLQGYCQRNGKPFIVKEIGACIPSESRSSTCHFKPPAGMKKLSSDEEYFVLHHQHKIPFEGGCVDYSLVIPMLEQIVGHRTIYVKGRHQVAILAALGFHARDLDLLACPQMKFLPTISHVACHLLDHQRNTYCALRRALKLGEFLKMMSRRQSAV